MITFKSHNIDGKERKWSFKNTSELEARWLSDECDLPANDDKVFDVKVNIHTVCVDTFEELLDYLGIISTELNPLSFRMVATLEFNRPIDKDKDFISPGGYCFKLADGREISFDFEDYYGNVDLNHPTVVGTCQYNPDYDSFKDLETLTVEDLENIVEIVDFFVDTGESDDAAKLAKVLQVVFEINPNNKVYEKPICVVISADVLERFNSILKK